MQGEVDEEFEQKLRTMLCQHLDSILSHFAPGYAHVTVYLRLPQEEDENVGVVLTSETCGEEGHRRMGVALASGKRGESVVQNGKVITAKPN